MLYRNEHFQKRDVEGTARMTIQQPTVKGCNPNKPTCKSDFRSLEQLPYCMAYNGPDVGIKPEHKQRCVFADQHTLAPTGMLESNMLIPTRIDQMVEHRNCAPSAENHYTCDNEFSLDTEPEIIYTADVERFTLMLAHSFRRDTLQGNNGEIQGYFMECEVTEETAGQKVSELLEGGTE